MPLFLNGNASFNTPPQTFAQVLDSTSGAIDNLMRGQMLAQYAQQYPQMLQNQVGMSNNDLATSNINLQTLPQMNQADLAIKQAQPNLINAQAAESYARVPLMGAQTNLTNQQATYLPFEDMVKAQQAAQMSSRFGAAYQVKQALDAMAPAARETWIAQHQAEYTQMVNDLANRTNNNNNLLTPALINRFYPGVYNSPAPTGIAGVTAPTVTNNNPTPTGMSGVVPAVAPNANVNPSGGIVGSLLANNSTSSLPNGIPYNNNSGSNMTPGMPMPPMSTASTNGVPYQNSGTTQGAPPMINPSPTFAPSTPDQINQVRLANQMAANKSLTTAATQRQTEGAIQVESMMNDPGFQQHIQDAANYAGALGKGQAAIDALSQTNPRAYENYLSVMTQDMPLLLNRIKTLDGMGATDAQREELNNLYSSALNSLTTNPSQFITQVNNLGKRLDAISQAVQKSSTPINSVNRLSGFNPINDPTASSTNTSTSNSNLITVSNGKQTWQISPDKLSVAKQRGYNEVQ